MPVTLKIRRWDDNFTNEYLDFNRKFIAMLYSFGIKTPQTFADSTIQFLFCVVNSTDTGSDYRDILFQTSDASVKKEVESFLEKYNSLNRTNLSIGEFLTLIRNMFQNCES